MISESLNSNTLNVLVGICLPALLIGFAPPTSAIVYAAIWLLGMKFVTLVAASHRNDLHRAGGAIIIVLYLVFVLGFAMWDN